MTMSNSEESIVLPNGKKIRTLIIVGKAVFYIFMSGVMFSAWQNTSENAKSEQLTKAKTEILKNMEDGDKALTIKTQENKKIADSNASSIQKLETEKEVMKSKMEAFQRTLDRIEDKIDELQAKK